MRKFLLLFVLIVPSVGCADESNAQSLITVENSAVFLAALAALFSAVAAFLALRTQEKIFQHSERPELMLTDWVRPQSYHVDDNIEIIKFTKIENVGRGAALQILINSASIGEEHPKAILGTVRWPVVAANGHQDVNGEILIFWNNVTGNPGHKMVCVTLNITCFDVLGGRYETKYSLMVFEDLDGEYGQDIIAPNVDLTSRVAKKVS